MSLKKRVYSILIVSASKTFTASLTSLLPESLYDTVSVASGINCAKRSLAERSYDFIIINSPFPFSENTFRVLYYIFSIISTTKR